MVGHYEIIIGLNIYTVNLIDNKAKITWEKTESGLVFKKQLKGNFILNRSTNEVCYDAINAMTHCDTAILRIANPSSTVFPAYGKFTIRDIEYNTDKCLMTIKPRYSDNYNVDIVLDKDFNIINDIIPVHNITYRESYQFEFVTYYKENVNCTEYTFDEGMQQWINSAVDGFPYHKVFNDTVINGSEHHTTWSYYSQINFHPSPVVLSQFFDVTTTWFREVKYVAKAIDPNNNTPPPQGSSSYAWVYLLTTTINGVHYNKYVRNVDFLLPRNLYGNIALNNFSQITSSLIGYYGLSETRTLTRARKLNDIIDYFRDELNCLSWSSKFFKDFSNPLSGLDLTNLMIMQKSDAIYVNGQETSDPATLGIITFRELMEQLWAMFQVTWVIKDNVLYIEHISYFKNNFSYNPNNTVGIDLTLEYPDSLIGTHAYSYETNVALREKFAFQDASNLDFIGTDIHYADCITDGDTKEYRASKITTDIDPTYLDNGDRDGFVLFHCNDENYVIETIGALSQLSTPNVHLGFANLHEAYWKSNRQLTVGNMNNVYQLFSAPHRKLKKQVPIEFPYCIEDFEAKINNPVRTTMGDGEIVSAEYNIKTGNVKIELAYL